MAGVFTITLKCRRCFGSGTIPPDIGGNPNGSCDLCGGSGETSWDTVDLTDLMDKVEDVLGKCNDILERLEE